MKSTFTIISRYFTQHFADVVYCKAPYDKGNKLLLFDVNPKTKFLEVPKIL